jgi:hypothetical protein
MADTIQLTPFQQEQGGRQAFQFADGSGFSAQGQTVPAVANAQTPTQSLAQTSTQIGAPSVITPVKASPSPVINSTSIPSVSGFDLQSAIKTNLDRQSTLLDQINTFYNVTPEEQQYQQRYNDLLKQSEDTQLNAQAGLNAIEDKPIAMEFITGQQAALERQANLKLQTLGILQGQALRTLQNTQAGRQSKLEAAKFLYDANRNQISDTIALYKATAPENIANTVDPTTGEMTVTMRNPVTGELTQKNLGVVQTPKKQIDNVTQAKQIGVNKPFYTIDGQTVINSNNGREYSTPEQAAADGVDIKTWGNVQNVDLQALEQAKVASEIVAGLISTYPDAGILPTDSVAVAENKLSSSRIYGDKVRPPVRAGGSGGSSGSGGGSGGGSGSSASLPGGINTSKLSAGQRDTVSTYLTLKDLANEAIALGERTGYAGTGGFYTGSVSQFLAKNFGWGSPEQEQLRNLIGNIKGTIAKARGGTSFTPNEEKLLESYTPTINDSEVVLRTKLEGLTSFIDKSITNIAGQPTQQSTQQGGYTGTTSSGLGYTIIP